MNLQFDLNGKTVSVETAPDRRLIDLLREDLGLTGSKEGCGTGECGACTILVDGETRLACLMLAAQVEGSRVLTIEGLAETAQGKVLQDAFVTEGAVQCGFCTPGMEMAALALIQKEAMPDRDQIRRALSGNLCRCTGYGKIVDAVEKAVREIRKPGEQP